MTIKLAEFGETLTPRALGVRIMRSVLPKLQAGDRVCFSFHGVRTMSTGFAKELFGGLLKHIGRDFPERVTFEFGDNREILLPAVKRGMSSVSKRPATGATRVTFAH